MTIQQLKARLDAQRVEYAALEATELILQDDLARDMDAAIDAGEFSGPSHDRVLAAKLEAIAIKYNITVTELENALHAEIEF